MTQLSAWFPKLRSILVLSVLAGLLHGVCVQAQDELFESRIRQVVNAGRPVESMVLSPDGRWGAVGAKSGDVGLIALSTPGQLQWVAHLKGKVYALAFNRAGSLLAAAGDDATINLIDVRTDEIRTLRGHHKRVRSVAFSPDGSLIASGGDDKEIRLWDAQSGADMYTLPCDSCKSVIHLGFNEIGTTLFVVDYLGEILEWDVKNRRRLRQDQDPAQMIRSAATDFSGSELVLGGENITSGGVRTNGIRLYDADRMVVSKNFSPGEFEVDALSVSPDHNYLAAGRNNIRHSDLSLYDIHSGSEIVSYPAGADIKAVAFSPDGHSLASADASGEIRIYDVKGVTPGGGRGDLVGMKFHVMSSSSSPLIPAHAELTIAVIDFDANGVEASTAHTITDLMHTRIAANRAITLVDRSRVERVIREQNFQYSDRVDPTSAVRLGKMLGASKMVFGAVGKLGTSTNIHTEMIDVETGRIDGSVDVICQQCHDEDLPEAIAALKRSLVEDYR